MANYLKMAKRSAIQTLRERNWSCRRISRELGIHLDTVRKYAKSDNQNSKQVTNAPPGLVAQSSTGPVSNCEPYREIIKNKLDMGLSRQRIWQDLRDDHGSDVSYHSVRRFVNRLSKNSPVPFRRLECRAGEEAQIDFGTGAPVITKDGRRKRTHVIRVVLSFSRKSYSEAVFRQTGDNFINCLENAFRHFGGVPQTLVIDNLKAAVNKADWYDPEIHPKIESFCRHYGTAILPCKPYTPRHKGKVEKAVAYVKNNALKGRSFKSLSEQNQFLLSWESRIADTRIHGTTRKQVGKLFTEQEKPALLRLPVGRFPLFTEAVRSVHRDGHIEVERAYYSVPPEYTGRKVWARWDGHVVRVFNRSMEQIVVHAKVEPGRFQTQEGHIHSEKRTKIENGVVWMLERVSLIGVNAERWARQMLEARGIQGIRVLLGLLNMTNTYNGNKIDNACKIALSHNAFRLKTIRSIIKHGGDRQLQMEFIDEHPIIRDISSYGEFVREVLG
jgi:transposase